MKNIQNDMSDEIRDFDDPSAIEGRLEGSIESINETIGELRRLARVEPHRRGGPGSKDAKKYELGSTLILLGFSDIEARELTGLLAHPELMLRWLAEAAMRLPNASLAELVRLALKGEERRAFCRQWGRIIEWRYRMPLYRSSVAKFIRSGKAGPEASWRTLHVTEDQMHLIRVLTRLLDEEAPELQTRGEAFEWILDRGGNPKYWLEPSLPTGGFDD